MSRPAVGRGAAAVEAIPMDMAPRHMARRGPTARRAQPPTIAERITAPITLRKRMTALRLPAMTGTRTLGPDMVKTTGRDTTMVTTTTDRDTTAVTSLLEWEWGSACREV